MASGRRESATLILTTHRTSPKNLFVCDFVYSFLWRVFDFFIIL